MDSKNQGVESSLLEKFTPLTKIQQQHFVVIDQGEYKYRLNGEVTDLKEPWQILKNGGLTIIRSVRYSESYQVTLAVVAHISENNQQIRISYSESNKPVIDAEYHIDNHGNWRVIQSHPGDIFQQQGQQDGLVLFPLLRVFSGAMLNACRLAKGKERSVLIPDICLTTKYSHKLKPSFDSRKTKYVARTNKGMKYNFLSQHYREENAEFYINNSGLLSYYKWQQSDDVLWQATLHQ